MPAETGLAQVPDLNWKMIKLLLTGVDSLNWSELV